MQKLKKKTKTLFHNAVLCCCLVASVISDSLQPSVHGILQALLQGIFPAQELNPRLLCLLHGQAGSLPLAPPGKPHAVHSKVRQKL